MKHFQHIPYDQLMKILYQFPSEFTKSTDKEKLAVSLGATLYTPGTKRDIAESLIHKKYLSLASNVLCLEDAIGDQEVEEAERNLFVQLEILLRAIRDGRLDEHSLPLLFVRVRSPNQLERLLRRRDELRLLTGFNLPKFSASNARDYFGLIENVNRSNSDKFYAMPILETPDVIYHESRQKELDAIQNIIDEFESLVLNIRLGGTDFSSLYGLRRGVDFTIYDIQVIRDVIADVVNRFGRSTSFHAISGCVWEYFPDHRFLEPSQPDSRRTDGGKQPKDRIHKEIEGLIREVILDKANGLVGKTIIHPSHITYVNALQVVTYEEYQDALLIIENQGRGALKGEQGNKMNETRPHFNWAKKILNKATIYGVLKPDADHVELF